MKQSKSKSNNNNNGPQSTNGKILKSLVNQINQVNKKSNRKKRNNLSKTSPKIPEYGQQMNDIMSQGYGKTLSMYPSTAAYGKCYADPFELNGARVPRFPILSTSMETYFVTGKGTTNSNGVGWVTAIPLYMTVGDTDSVTVSTGTSGDTFNSGTYNSFKTDSLRNIPDYYEPESGGLLSVRIVSMGIRVRYLGTKLNQAGTCVCAQTSPFGSSLSGQDYSGLKKMPGFKETTFADNSWHSITRHVEMDEDLEFCNYYKSASQWRTVVAELWTADEDYRLGMMLACEPNQNFEFECRIHVEVSGIRLANRGVTISDHAGVDKIVSSLASLRHKDSTTRDHNVGGGWQGFLNILKKGAQTVLPMIPSLLTKLLL